MLTLTFKFFMTDKGIIFFIDINNATYCVKSYTIFKAFQLKSMKILRPFVHFSLTIHFLMIDQPDIHSWNFQCTVHVDLKHVGA